MTRSLSVAFLALLTTPALAQDGVPTREEIAEALKETPVITPPAEEQTAPEAGTDSMEATAEVAPAGDTPTPESIEAVTYDGGPLPDGQSSLTAKVQILLDRAGISPGVIDGWRGGMSESAILAFETREGLPQDGELDPEVWAALGGDEPGAMLQGYEIQPGDLEGLVDSIPEDYAEKAQMEAMAHTSVAERLAEWFHMDEDFIRELNPDATWQPGETIVVAATGGYLETPVARIEVRKSVGRLAAFDAEGNMIGNYPVTVGSAQTPSPSGEVEVTAVAFMPNYTYNPDINFTQGDNTEVLIVPPGPNGPVGSIWIDLSEPTYGLHGTPEPASLFSAQSNGCVRLTNWDAEELARLVSPGVPVSFIE